MRLEEIEAAIANLERIREVSHPDDPVTAKPAIDSALQELRTLQAELAKRDAQQRQNQLAEPLTLEDLGINDQGVVINRQKMQESIQRLGDRVRTAQQDHRTKKAEAIGFIHQFRPKVSLKSSSAAVDVLNELEKTRRVLIVLKKHLGNLNAGRGANDKYQLEVGTKEQVKATFSNALLDIVAEQVVVELRHPAVFENWRAPKPLYATRYFYNTACDPSLTLSDLQRIHELNRSSADTADYVFKDPAARQGPVVILYPGDPRERAALFLGASNEATALSSRSRIPEKRDVPKLSNKHQLVKEALQNACHLAKVNSGKNASPLQYVQLLSFLSERICLSRILITELISCWHGRRNQATFVKQTKTLGRSLDNVVERLAEWEATAARLGGYQKRLSEATNQVDQSAYKQEVIDIVRQLTRDRIGGIPYDELLSALEGKIDTSEFKKISERTEEPHLSAEGLTGLQAMLVWIFKKNRPALKRARVEWTALLHDWPSDDVRNRALAALPKSDVEFLQRLAQICLETEVAQLAQIARWARGDIEQREKVDWLAYGKQLEKDIRAIGGVVVYLDRFEGAYAPMRTMIMRALFGADPSDPSQDDGSAWRKCLYVGAASIAIQVYCAVEATVATYFTIGARLALQVAGTISQDDDRAVRAKVAFSVVLSGEVTASASAQDLIEQNMAVDLLNAKLSAAAESNLVTLTKTKCYQSPEHMAACWADTLAYLQACLQKPFSWLADPFDPAKRYKLFDPDKADTTQEACLQQLLGANSDLKSDFDLLRERRVKGFSVQGPSTKVTFDVALATFAAHEETKAHKVDRTKFSATDFPGGKRQSLRWCHRPTAEGRKETAITTVHNWTKSQLASLYRNIDLSGAWSIESGSPGEENPLDLVPLQDSASETAVITGSFQAGAGTIDFSFSHIANHPIADNDGMYLNLRANRVWGASVGSGFSPVSLSFSKTRAKVFDPEVVRRQVNRIWELGRAYYRHHAKEYSPQKRPDGAEVDTWLKISRSSDGAGMLAILTTLSVYGRFEVNYCHTGHGFELQYARIWRTYSLAVAGEYEALPFLKVGAEMAANLEYCPYETLGVNTISYILTVYNGFRRRKPGKRKYWDDYHDYHIEELHAFFNWFHPGQNWFKEIQDSKAANADPLTDQREAAQAKAKLDEAADRLLQLADITIPAHYKAREYDSILQARPASSQFPVPRAFSSPTRARIVIPAGFGSSFVMIHDPIAFRCSPAFTLESYKVAKNRPISPEGIPIFTLRSENPYKILWGVTAPQLFKSAKLELLDKTESVVWEQVIDKSQSEILGYAGEDLSQRPQKGSRVKSHHLSRRRFVKKYGDNFPHLPRRTDNDPNDKDDQEYFYIETIDWDGKKGGMLRKYQLSGGNALDAQGSPYCLRLVVSPMGVLRDWGAAKPVAWTYFAVLDEPIKKLEGWLHERGNFQPFEQASHWINTEIQPTSADTDLALVGENDTDPAELLVADEVGKQHPTVGIDSSGAVPVPPIEVPVVPPPVPNLIQPVEEPQDNSPTIKDGYGEFLVVDLQEGELRSVGKQDFAWAITQAIYPNTPFAYLDTNPALEEIPAYLAGRTDRIDAKLAVRRAGLQAVFIPRTLYELLFVNEVLEQEHQEDPEPHWKFRPLQQYSVAYVTAATDLDLENIVQRRRLNRAFIRQIRALPGMAASPKLPLTRNQMDTLMAAEVARFKSLVAGSGTDDAIKSRYRRFVDDNVTVPHSLGRTLHGWLADRLDRMGHLLTNAMLQECDATGKLLLYRGTEYDPDRLDMADGFPMSFNTGLFSGVFYDDSGVTFTPLFSLQDNNYGYCMKIPFEDLRRASFPFHVPRTNALKQLSGKDQHFHAWSKTTIAFVYQQTQIQPGSHLPYLKDLRSLQQIQSSFAPYFAEKVVLV